MNSNHYQRAALSLFALAGIYLAGLAYALYVSVAVGEMQNFFSIALWLAFVLWCGWSMRKDSNTARKWGIFLFGLHIFGGIFYIVFPIPFDITLPLIFVIIISSFGLFHAVKAKKPTA